jgi:hypothetical protein
MRRRSRRIGSSPQVVVIVTGGGFFLMILLFCLAFASLKSSLQITDYYASLPFIIATTSTTEKKNNTKKLRRRRPEDDEPNKHHQERPAKKKKKKKNNDMNNLKKFMLNLKRHRSDDAVMMKQKKYHNPMPNLNQSTISPQESKERNRQYAQQEWQRMKDFQMTADHLLEKEFPYPLACQQHNNNTRLEQHYGQVPIILAYHVGMLNNWKTVVADQLNTLQTCGGGWTKQLDIQQYILSYSAGNNNNPNTTNNHQLEVLQSFLQPYAPLFDMTNATYINNQGTKTTTSTSTSTIVLESTAAPWEGPIMDQIRDTCKSSSRYQKDGIVFYFHNKGVSKYHAHWRHQLEDTWTYSRSLYWRKFMEYFLLERPHLCLHQLVNKKAKACGILFRRAAVHWSRHPHYSGNFWAARCSYLKTLPAMSSNSYEAAEFWIGRKGNSDNPDEFVSLAEADLSLYQHLILPEEYVNYTAYWETEAAKAQ